MAKNTASSSAANVDSPEAGIVHKLFNAPKNPIPVSTSKKLRTKKSEASSRTSAIASRDEVSASREDYEEFLKTQHFFYDTETYTSSEIHRQVENADENSEHDSLFFETLEFQAPSESEFLPAPAPILPINPEEPSESHDFFAATHNPLVGNKEEASPPHETSFSEVSEALTSITTHHETPPSPAPETETVDWKVGEIIDGRYAVKAIIGRGGMGIVYQVYHREWDLDLAVKMPLVHLVANQGLKARFVAEAQTWIDLGLHPNIVQCWYVREFGGIPRVFMDYLTGGSLKDWMLQEKIGPGDWDRILDLMIQACDGLGYAHDHGIKAHRDVKPGNLLLTASGELRVTDFGIAKRYDHEEEEEQYVAVAVAGKQHTVTVTGADVGTPEYGAPEQWGEAKYADARTDIYALGGVLFELCCGRRAFDDGQHQEQPYAIIGRHLFSPVPDPRSFNQAIPPALADVMRQCLAKDPEHRPQSMRELRASLVELYAKIVGTPYWKEVPQAAELRSSTLNNRAVSLLDLGRTTEAFAVLDEALKLDAHHAESVYNKVLLEWREERIADDEVVRRLKEARQVSSRAGVYLGMIHLERGAAEEAEQAFTNALQDSKLAKDSTVWKGLGDALIAQEKYEEARHAYQEALELVPGDKVLEERRALAFQHTRSQDGQVLFPYPHCVRTFVGSSDLLETLVLSPDAQYALASNSEGAKLWNLTTGKFLWTYAWSEEGRGPWTFKGYAGSRTSIVMTPDEQLAFSGGSDDCSVWMWNLETGQCVHRFEGHTSDVSALAMLPNGQRVLSGSLDTTLRLWDILNKECLRVFTGYQEPVTALAVTPDGQYGLSGSGHFLCQWDLVTAKIVRTFRGHGDDVTTIAVHPDQQIVISGSRDKTIRLWKLSSGRCLKTFIGHLDGVTAVTLTPDGRFAISASQDKTLRVWDLKTWACVNVLQGHTSHVMAVTVTPDSQFAFSVSRDRTLRLWRIETGKCLRVFQEFSHWLEALALTKDGQYALLGNHEEIRMKHLSSQTYRQFFRKHTAQESHLSSTDRGELSATKISMRNLPPGENFLTVIGLKEQETFSIVNPEGNLGISGGAYETLYVWEVHTERKQRLWGMRGLRGLQVFKTYRSILRSIVITPDGKLALTGGEDARARVWELPAVKCLQVFEGHRGSINAVALTPDARLLLTGSTDTTVRLWDRETGICLRVFEGHDESVTAVAITPDGQFAVSGSGDKTLRLWDLTTGKCLRTFEDHEDTILAVAITPDAQYALSATNAHTLRLWRLDARVPRQPAALQVCRHLGHSELEIFRKRFQRFLARAEAARRAGNIATAYTFLTLARSISGYERDPKALALNASLSAHLGKKALRRGRLLHTLSGHEKTITDVATTLDGRFILSGSQDKTLRVWGLVTGQHFRMFKGHSDYVNCVNVTPNRHVAISGSRDKTLRLWALATGECLKVLTGHDEGVTSVAVSPDGRFVISGSRDATLRQWSLTTGQGQKTSQRIRISAEEAYITAKRVADKSLRILKGHSAAVEAVAISPNSRFLISASRDATLRLWQLSTGRCTHVFRGHSRYVTAVTFSQNGQFVVSASHDKTLRVWRTANGMCLHILRGHEAPVSSVAVTSDGHFAVSGSWDRTVRLWNLFTGECVRIFEGHEGEVEAVALTADGHWAVSGGRDATLQIWEFDWELSAQRNPNKRQALKVTAANHP